MPTHDPYNDPYDAEENLDPGQEDPVPYCGNCGTELKDGRTCPGCSRNCDLCGCAEQILPKPPFAPGSSSLLNSCDVCGRKCCNNCCNANPRTGLWADLPYDIICKDCHEQLRRRCEQVWEEEYGQDADYGNPYADYDPTEERKKRLRKMGFAEEEDD